MNQIDLTKILNQEQLLYLCLDVVSKVTNVSKRGDAENYAMNYVVAYAMNIVGVEDMDLICKKVTEMMVDHILDGLIKRNLVSEGLDGTLEMTEDGIIMEERLNG